MALSTVLRKAAAKPFQTSALTEITWMHCSPGESKISFIVLLLGKFKEQQTKIRLSKISIYIFRDRQINSVKGLW